MDAIISFDKYIYPLVVSIQRDWLTPIMVFFTNIITTEIVLVVFVLIFLWFVYKRNWLFTSFATAGIFGGYIIEKYLKLIVARERPPLGAGDTDFSFPSGHATMAAVLFGVIAYCFKDYIKHPVARRLFIALNILVIIIIGFSRLYLGVHWFSDVMAGLIIGAVWLVIVRFGLKKIFKK